MKIGKPFPFFTVTSLYFQLPWTSGTLVCKHCKLDSLNVQLSSDGASNEAVCNDEKGWIEWPSWAYTYNNTYAECGPWGIGHTDYKISLTLNGKTYITDENSARANGPIEGTCDW